MADMIADKTDNVEVVVALDGSPIDDDDDIGNEYNKALGQTSRFEISNCQDHVLRGEQRGASLHQQLWQGRSWRGAIPGENILVVNIETYNSFESRVRKMSQGFHMSPPLAG